MKTSRRTEIIFETYETTVIRCGSPAGALYCRCCLMSIPDLSPRPVSSAADDRANAVYSVCENCIAAWFTQGEHENK